MAWLLDRYSDAYASNQYRALQQFFKWLSAEEGVPDPMAGLRPPKVTTGVVPVFTGTELVRLERACGPRVRRAAGRGHHRGAEGGWHPLVGAGRNPVRPAGPAAQRHRRLAAGDPAGR
jgi:hypothetical protein